MSEPLWIPSSERIARSGISRYLDWLEEKRNLSFDGYESLWQWSTTDIENFWETVWQFTGVISHSPYQCVLDNRAMPGARWFPGATLNFAEQLLANARDSRLEKLPALIAESECRQPRKISWRELEAGAGALAATLKAEGIDRDDRVVAYMPNIPETLYAMLATASLGAVWSISSPDMGATSVLERFRQIEPSVLFAMDGYRYGGKDFDRRQVVREIARQLPSIKVIIFLPFLNPDARLEDASTDEGEAAGTPVPRVISWKDAVGRPAPLEFTPVPFDHPLWIVYSSGTTGMPKPIIHCHGGVVIQSLKANVLHFDIHPGDRFFWFTSTNWIMWNFLINTLHSGACAVMFDGNPGYPDQGTLWRLAERNGIQFFGTSPAFINLCMKAGVKPAEQFDLSALQTVGSTGSPLTEEGFNWVYKEVHPDVMLACISGGTDPGACFLTCCPMLATYAGEMSCRELGVATHAFNEAGLPVMNEVGELVMTQPIPSLPTGFWGDTDGSRYFSSYFDTYPGVWCHGDWLRLIEREASVTGIIYGRSDATINRHGIRMGTSELYGVVESIPEILDSLIIDLEYLGAESYLVLFVVLPEKPDGTAAYEAGRASRGKNPAADITGVEPALRERLLQILRSDLSARHVPNEVFAIPQVPRTLSGKKMEVPVKKILLGQPPEKSANRDSMLNPLVLDWFIEFARGRGHS